MGLFGFGNKEKKMEKELQKIKQCDAEDYGYRDTTLRDYWKLSFREDESRTAAAEAAYCAAKMIEDGKFAGCTNYRYLLEFKERAANLGHEKAKEELDPLKKKVMNDSLEQFHLWFNTQGYEVAEDYASLAARCGSEEAETMLKVIDTQRKIVRDIAIDPYNQACKMVYAGIEDKGVFELFAKAAGYGLTEAMYNAVVIYYDIAHKYDYDHRVQSRFFPSSPDCDPFCAMGPGGACALRWIRKAILAGDENAARWWKERPNEQYHSSRSYFHFNIGEYEKNYGLNRVWDMLPRLEAPAPGYQWPENTYTYEKAKARCKALWH